MKKYTNPLNRLLVVEFSDGESHFLIKDSVVVSEKTVKRLDGGIEISEVKTAETAKKPRVRNTLKVQEKDT